MRSGLSDRHVVYTFTCTDRPDRPGLMHCPGAAESSSRLSCDGTTG